MARPVPLVPAGFEVPTTLATERLQLRPLGVVDVVRDFDAVITSTARIRRQFGSIWPAGLTLEQNLVDLGWHQKLFQLREAFAYTVLDPAGERCLGCVYVDPTDEPGAEAEVRLWVRDDPDADALDAHLEAGVRAWLERDWPFGRVAFPGR